MAVADGARYAGPGRQIEARRTAQGMSIKALAERSGIHRDTIRAIEAGSSGTPRGATVGAILSALDRFEEEAGADLPEGTRRVGEPGEGLIELTVEGGFGRVVVKGPAGNLAEMRETVAALIRDSRAAREENS
jgi:transcriptional regulator with XRE-family HTH domain